MSTNQEPRATPRVVLLPLPIWLLIGLWHFAAALLRKCRKSRSLPLATNLPHATTHQKDPRCAQFAWLLFAKLNYYRLSQGLPQMTWNEQLEQSALYHAKRMIETGEFAHVLSDGVELSRRVKAVDYRYSVCAENLAYYESRMFAIEELAEGIHDGWVHSPGHHANLVGDCTEVGIGVLKAGYRYYAVQNFGKPFSHAFFGIRLNASPPQAARHS